ncbi:hypothetical protein OS493_014608 [Desmophyllum pertusum]|uniref:Exonuclease domain-containing protein n=1 Tax=Desmophyllum pertusum TaxID=174260 RepID=A0A9X0CL39_9CNID|nr:hypothetical protein OS493_014608 [Desmophyllum pertusum]
MLDQPSPLYFLYDCEATGGLVYEDHIVEIAAVLQPLPFNLQTKLPTNFQSLVNTSKRIAAPVLRKCGINQTDLLNQPKLSEVLPNTSAHNGFVYDFPLLFAEVDRRYPLLTNKLFSHICFGDTLANLQTLTKQGKVPLQKKQKLGMPALHELYFPNKEFQATDVWGEVAKAAKLERQRFQTTNPPLRKGKKAHGGPRTNSGRKKAVYNKVSLKGKPLTLETLEEESLKACCGMTRSDAIRYRIFHPQNIEGASLGRGPTHTGF